MSSTASKPNLAELYTPESRRAVADADGRVLRASFQQLATAAEVIGDFAAAALALIGAYSIYHLLELGKTVVYPVQSIVGSSLAFAFFFVILLDRQGVYHTGSGMLRVAETARILRVSVETFLLLLPVSIFSAHLISRLVLGIGFFLVPFMVISEKQMMFSIVRHLHSRGRGVRKAIIYGAGFTGKRVFSSLLRSRKVGINPIYFVDDDECLAGKDIFAHGYRRESSSQILSGPVTSEMIRRTGADLVVVAIPSLAQEKMAAVAAAAKEADAKLIYVPSQTVYEDAQVSYVDIDGILLATVDLPQHMPIYERAKRLMDFLLSLIGIILLSPILAVIALAIRMDSAGPAIFKQKRVGKDGRLFDIYKFRTMRVDAPQYGFSPTESVDPRITRLGRTLRKTSLDELAQLFNVLKGDMSLVGPRPEMPFIVEQYGPRVRGRLSVVPGITGLWQISADRAYLIHENPHYDLYYVRNRGFFMDLAILLHTFIFAVKGV
jgi:exopolysaccharide biosynthesis polyprenyl glycosylphosphotransferase